MDYIHSVCHISTVCVRIYFRRSGLPWSPLMLPQRLNIELVLKRTVDIQGLLASEEKVECRLRSLPTP